MLPAPDVRLHVCMGQIVPRARIAPFGHHDSGRKPTLNTPNRDRPAPLPLFARRVARAGVGLLGTGFARGGMRAGRGSPRDRGSARRGALTRYSVFRTSRMSSLVGRTR